MPGPAGTVVLVGRILDAYTRKIGSTPKQPTFRLLSDRGAAYSMPFAPLPVDLTRLAGTWVQLPRPGRVPLLLQSEGSLPEMRFSLTLARPDRDRDVEDLLDALRKAAKSGDRFTVSYGPQERGLWHLTDLALHANVRQPLTNRVTNATADLTLTKVSDVTRVGPLSGGVKPSPTKKPPARKTYTVRKGDTLWEIAERFYHDGEKWPKIADANHITNPRRLPVGKVLKLP